MQLRLPFLLMATLALAACPAWAAIKGGNALVSSTANSVGCATPSNMTMYYEPLAQSCAGTSVEISTSTIATGWFNGTLNNVGCSSLNGGALRYVNGSMSFCDGSSWQALGSGGGSSISNGTTGVYTNSNGFISLTTAGTTTGYFDSVGRLVVPGVSVTTNQLSATTAYFSGNVGIGTTTPNTTFHVSGSSSLMTLQILRDNNISEGGQINLYRSLDNTSAWAIDVNGSSSAPNFRIINTASGTVPFYISGPGVGYFANGVGIGTTTPSGTLGVFGSIRARQGAPDSADSSARGYGFGIDGDTGMFSPGTETAANGTVSFYTNNVQRMVINSSGVGIGISPANPLDVSGSIMSRGATSGYFFTDRTTASSTVLYRSGDKTRLWDSSLGDQLTLDNSNGYVGIGTTAPSATLHVRSGTGYGALMLGDNGGVTNHTVTHETNGSFGIWVGTFGAGVRQMTITSSGLVGFGTNSPRSTLDVYGGVRARQGAPDSGDSTNLGYAFGPDGDTGIFSPGTEVASNGTMAFYSNNAQRMVINSSGVGIGTAAPSATLHVITASNGTDTPGAGISLGKSSVGDYQIQLAGNTNPHIDFANETTSDYDMRIVLGGDNQLNVEGGNLVVAGTGTTCTIGNGTTATNCTSDARLKTAVKPLEGSLEKISKLHGVTFQWKDPAKHGRYVGVIAQDVEAVFPEVVGSVSESTLGTAMTVDYGALVAPLIEAVKELKAENDNLRADQRRQSARLSELERAVEALQSSPRRAP